MSSRAGAAPRGRRAGRRRRRGRSDRRSSRPRLAGQQRVPAEPQCEDRGGSGPGRNPAGGLLHATMMPDAARGGALTFSTAGLHCFNRERRCARGAPREVKMSAIDSSSAPDWQEYSSFAVSWSVAWVRSARDRQRRAGRRCRSQGWGAPSARGSGAVRVNTCRPTCAGGRSPVAKGCGSSFGTARGRGRVRRRAGPFPHTRAQAAYPRGVGLAARQVVVLFPRCVEEG